MNYQVFDDDMSVNLRAVYAVAVIVRQSEKRVISKLGKKMWRILSGPLLLPLNLD